MTFQLRIHMGAAHNSVTVDGTTFDRSTMSREDRNRLRHLIVGAFRKDHPEAAASSRPTKANSRNRKVRTHA